MLRKLPGSGRGSPRTRPRRAAEPAGGIAEDDREDHDQGPGSVDPLHIANKKLNTKRRDGMGKL